MISNFNEEAQEIIIKAKLEMLELKNSIITADALNCQKDAKEFSRAVRMHWGVENNLHWQLDFTFKDDKNTTMDKTGAKNLQQLKKISMAILKLVKESYKLSMKRIRYVLSLNYEEEIEKLFSMLDINMIKEALEQ